MTDLTVENLRAALDANASEPHGKPRVVRAEALLDAADRLGDLETRFLALSEVIEAYQFGGEGFRSPVPFARLLRIWDEQGSALPHADRWSYETHWMFKWMTSSLLLLPEVPLATVHGFVDDMERRYRDAGYGMRAVHAARFHVADHLGDLVEAEAQHARWLAADRDLMSDCHACELLAQGRWRADRLADGDALELWSATLDGRLTCAEEPVRTLAASLESLVRLGRLDEARVNHLRGYRLVRGRENLRKSLGEHIEFCALTGNEGRGLELLAEHRGWFDDSSSPYSQMSFETSVVLLLRRLADLGSAGIPVPGPQTRDWPAAELLAELEGRVRATAARFDRRNGNDAVSRLVSGRMAQQPLVDALPLGVRSVLPVSSRVAQAAVATPPAEDLPGLIEEAWRLLDSGHPDSAGAWEAVAALAASAGIPLGPKDEAGLWEQRGLTAAGDEEWATASECAVRAAGLHAETAGGMGRSLGLQARAGLGDAIALKLPLADASVLFAHCGEQAQRLLETGEAEITDVLLIRHCQAALARLALNLHEESTGPDHDAALDGFRAAAEELLSQAEAHGVEHRKSSAHYMLADIALREQRPQDAIDELLSSLEASEAAGRPWSCLHPRFLLAQAYEIAALYPEAEETALEALSDAARWPAERFAAGYAHALLANVTGAQGRLEDSIRHAVDAAAWADRNGVPDLAVAARYGLAQTYERLGRNADAAAILEAAMPEFLEHLDEESAVRARWMLGKALTGLDDHRNAAEQFLLAVAVAENWPNQGAHAMLAADAAHALNTAGMTAEAERAFEKAIELLRPAGKPVLLAKTLRALAWTVYGEDRDGVDGDGGGSAGGGDGAGDDDGGVGGAEGQNAELVGDGTPTMDRALLLFADAEQVLDAALAGTEDAAELPEIGFQIAETQDQLARLHLQADLPDRALPYASKAADGFRALLPDHAYDYDLAEQMTAWLLDRFDGREAAVTRLEQAIAMAEAAGAEVPRCVSYLAGLR